MQWPDGALFQSLNDIKAISTTASQAASPAVHHIGVVPPRTPDAYSLVCVNNPDTT